MEPFSSIMAERASSGQECTDDEGGDTMAPGKSQRVNPVDRAQLAESPVKLSRVTALFSPYRWELALVVVIIVATSRTLPGATMWSVM